jgi:hypothetical protein
MPRDINGAEPVSLAQAKRQFDRWRGACRGPGRIPTDLWRLAAQAAAEHGLQRTAELLDLGAPRLRQWMERLGLKDSASEAATPQFIELTPLPLATAAQCRLEIDEPCGRKLRLSFQGPAVEQVAAVMAALARSSQP